MNDTNSSECVMYMYIPCPLVDYNRTKKKTKATFIVNCSRLKKGKN